MDLDSPYSISVLYQIVLEISGIVWGGGSKFAGQCEIFNVMKRKEELTKMAASYTTPTVSVVSLEFEGCLCGSFGRTTSSDPDDFEYGGKF